MHLEFQACEKWLLMHSRSMRVVSFCYHSRSLWSRFACHFFETLFCSCSCVVSATDYVNYPQRDWPVSDSVRMAFPYSLALNGISVKSRQWHCGPMPLCASHLRICVCVCVCVCVFETDSCCHTWRGLFNFVPPCTHSLSLLIHKHIHFTSLGAEGLSRRGLNDPRLKLGRSVREYYKRVNLDVFRI